MKNKKTKIAIIAVIALVLVTIGVTYAYWLITRTQTGENVITTGCLDISLSGENDITLSDQFPISDEDGMNLTPYTFTVTNNCNTSVDYHINLESIGDSSNSISSDSLKAVLNTNTPKKLYDYVGADTTISDAYEAYTLGYGILTAKDTDGSMASYELRLWIDENASVSEMNKTYTSKISVMIGQGVSSQGTNLSSLILADAETNNYLYTTTPDFSTVTTDGEYGLYSAEDDYGTSYYFRGDVENNYVKLGTWKEKKSIILGCSHETIEDSCQAVYEKIEACESANHAICKELNIAEEGDDMYWRIVRINGDGTIRLVYDGADAIINSVSRIAIIGVTDFDDTKYVGYTYDVNGTQTDSTIKGIVETWYKNNFESNYGKYVADSIFCNDREATVIEGVETTYGAYTRLNINKDPKLSCTQETDKYTVSSTKGNGLLAKPVGLMTADEIAMAGGKYGTSNSTFYLYTGLFASWSMSPYRTYSMEGNLWNVNSSGILDVYDFTAIEYYYFGGARPVINLKADVQFTGNGTIDSPYQLVTE